MCSRFNKYLTFITLHSIRFIHHIFSSSHSGCFHFGSFVGANYKYWQRANVNNNWKWKKKKKTMRNATRKRSSFCSMIARIAHRTQRTCSQNERAQQTIVNEMEILNINETVAVPFVFFAANDVPNTHVNYGYTRAQRNVTQRLHSTRQNQWMRQRIEWNRCFYSCIHGAFVSDENLMFHRRFIWPNISAESCDSHVSMQQSIDEKYWNEWTMWQVCDARTLRRTTNALN